MPHKKSAQKLACFTMPFFSKANKRRWLAIEWFVPASMPAQGLAKCLPSPLGT